MISDSRKDKVFVELGNDEMDAGIVVKVHASHGEYSGATKQETEFLRIPPLTRNVFFHR